MGTRQQSTATTDSYEKTDVHIQNDITYMFIDRYRYRLKKSVITNKS